ncbi:MAG: hypothetical protein ACJAYU_005160 [Bradymonadia bacterium]|jgi:hypothetical protein
MWELLILTFDQTTGSTTSCVHKIGRRAPKRLIRDVIDLEGGEDRGAGSNHVLLFDLEFAA